MRTCIFLSLFFAISTIAVRADEVRMVASDLLAEFITPTLKAIAKENKIDFNIEELGSLPALERLKSDETDLAIIAVPEGESVPDGFTAYPFAYNAAIVVVNDRNPIDEISIPRLGGIFGRNEELNFNTWGELGLVGWGGRNIKALVGPAEKSISLELFRYAVFSGGALKPGVSVMRDTEIEEALLGNITSIGILSSLPKSNKLKVLMVSDGKEVDSPAYGPSLGNIHIGDYPIRLAYFVVFSPRDEDKVKPLLRALLSEEVSSTLSKNDLFALPDTVRTQLLVDLNFE